MITVTLYRMPDDLIRRIVAQGHAGYAQAGQDIICAAISVIAQTTIGSLQDLAHLDIRFVLQDGHIELELPDPTRMQPEQQQIARILTESLVIGCVQVRDSYGKQYVRMKESQYA